MTTIETDALAWYNRMIVNHPKTMVCSALVAGMIIGAVLGRL
jgi:hypothetical protein